MSKHIKYLFFCVAILFIIGPSISKAEEININNTLVTENEEIGILNPKWEYYNSLSDEEKAKWDVVPEKYIVSNDKEQAVDYYVKKGVYEPIAYASLVPSAYDLRNVNGSNYVTAVKNQGSTSLCWAFAANASVETYLLRKNNIRTTLSERQLDYASSSNASSFSEGYNPYPAKRNLLAGGSFSSAAYFYAIGLSPVQMTGEWSSWNESTRAISLRDIFNLNNSNYLVTSYYKFPDISRNASESAKTTWRNKIKNYIMNYGSAYISTVSPQSTSKACYIAQASNGQSGVINWTDACEKSFTNETYNGTHAMAIIGWDDNYALSYCAYKNGTTNVNKDANACASEGGKYYNIKGAWILKNSWGNTSPYVYLAYSSDYLEVAGITGVVQKDYDNTYNSLSPQENIETSYKVKNVFYKPTPAEELKRVTFETNTTSSVSYQIYYGDKTAQNDSDYTLLGSVTANTPGRYSLDVKSGIILDKEDFVIYIKPSIGTSYTKPTNIYAFTKNIENTVSATTIAYPSSIKYNNNAYEISISSKTANLDTGVRLTFKIKDIYDRTIVTYTDNKSYVIAGSYQGIIALPTNLNKNAIYYIETYANNMLIGKNSFATGISLASTSLSGNLTYIIDSEDDLQYLTTMQYKFSNFALSKDITLTSQNFTPLGKDIVDNFRGSLDGQGYSILNLKQNSANTGLFHKIEATISNLKIKNVALTAGETSGVLASEAYNSTITNVLTEGSLVSSNASAFIGGIVGSAVSTDFKNVVNDTNLAGGKAGEIIGYLGQGSTITNALNQGLISGNKSAMSTFFHSTAFVNNRITNAVDLRVENSSSCTTPYNYSANQLLVANVIYLDEDNCNYLGTRASRVQLKEGSTYSQFGSDWTLASNGLPLIKDNPVTYISDFEPIGAKNLFTNVNAQVEITTSPSNASYKGVSLKSENDNIVKIINGTEVQGVAPGKATISVTTADGTYLTKEVDVYVLDDSLASRYDNGYLIVGEGVTENDLQKEDMTLKVSNKYNSRIATGSTIEYRIDNKVVGLFTAVIKGDLNGDGLIQANDMLMMKRHILELDRNANDQLTDIQLKAGDITGNGISSTGVLKVQRHILKLDNGGELQ